MFRGNHPTRVDDKGRLKLPVEFKRLVGEDFYITSRDGRRAQIWPLPEWIKVEAKLAAIPDFSEAKRKIVDRVSYYGQTAEIDAQGRLLLPQILREAAKLDGDAVVFGRGNYLEVANREEVRQSLENEPLTTEDYQTLANFGL